MTKKQFIVPKLNGLKTSSSPKTSFLIPNLFNKSSQDETKRKSFIIPSFGKALTTPTSTLGTSPNNREFKSLSEVVSEHLDSQMSAINEELINIKLEEEISTKVIEKIDKLSIIQDDPFVSIKRHEDISLLCSFDVRPFLKTDVSLKKAHSKFAKIFCRNFKKPYVKITKTKLIVPKKIKFFTFDIPSSDDGIRQHLKK